MALSLIINRFDPYTIEELEIDTALTEVHTYGNLVTDYPIEDGSDINDHVKREPEKLMIEGITSNTPIEFFSGTLTRFVRGDFTNRAQLAFNTLLGYAGYSVPKQVGRTPERVTEAKLLSIVTGYKTYTDMIITRLTFPRGPLSGDAAKYTVEFKKIKKVQAKTAQVIDLDDRKADNIKEQAAKTVNTGKNTVEKVDDSSFLYKAATSLRDALTTKVGQ